MPQIIHLPPVRLQKQKGVDPKVQSRVLEFLDRFPDGPPDDFLDRITNDVMLARFGYGSIEGRAVAVRALQALEKVGRVHIHYDDHGKKQKVPTVVQVRRRIEEPAPVTVLPVVPPKAPKPAFNTMRVAHGHSSDPRAARQQRRDRRIGDHNEERFHRLMIRLVGALTVIAPSAFIDGDASRSGRHCPSKGKIDRRDHCGDDVTLRLTTPIPATGAPHTTRLVYDVKSSRATTAEANARFKRITREGLKRAIAVNHLRSDREVIGEVLDDLVVVGLGTDTGTRQAILDHFSD